MAIHDYSSALDFLLDRINYEQTAQIPYQSSEFWLDRMRQLMQRLGNPHLRVPAVHVAGTKGKGSTASMIASILQCAGYRTGLYTSPHLERIEERFVINGVPCSPQEFVDLARSVEPVVRELDDEASAAGARGPTFFEVTTAMAFLHFAGESSHLARRDGALAEQRHPSGKGHPLAEREGYTGHPLAEREGHSVDIAVLEVGLGGRLDSTNVCRSCVSVITSISFDHTRTLGNTLDAIAREKAGIIKPGVPVVSGVVEPEPRDAIAEIAEKTGAPLRQRGQDFDAWPERGEKANTESSGSMITFRESIQNQSRSLAHVPLNLLGDHQIANAATAIAAINTLVRQGWRIPETAIREGLAQVHCPARVEIVRHRPLVVVDTAHNVASVDALCRTLKEESFSSQATGGLTPLARRKRVLIFGTSRDKDAAGMLRLLLPQFDDVVITRYLHNPRAHPVDELLSLAQQESGRLDSPHRARLHDASDPLAAWQLARQLAGDDALVCITGSFFLAADLRPVALAEQSA